MLTTEATGVPIVAAPPYTGLSVLEHDNSYYTRSQYGRRGALASRSGGNCKVRCLKCGRWFCAVGIGKHRAHCTGEQIEPKEATVRGHDTCGCGRMKAAAARVCWKCEDKNSDFDELDARIAAGVTTPRETLPIPDLGAMKAWLTKRGKEAV